MPARRLLQLSAQLVLMSYLRLAQPKLRPWRYLGVICMRQDLSMRPLHRGSHKTFQLSIVRSSSVTQAKALSSWPILKLG